MYSIHSNSVRCKLREVESRCELRFCVMEFLLFAIKSIHCLVRRNLFSVSFHLPVSSLPQKVDGK